MERIGMAMLIKKIYRIKIKMNTDFPLKFLKSLKRTLAQMDFSFYVQYFCVQQVIYKISAQKQYESSDVEMWLLGKYLCDETISDDDQWVRTGVEISAVIVIIVK